MDRICVSSWDTAGGTFTSINEVLDTKSDVEVVLDSEQGVLNVVQLRLMRRACLRMENPCIT